jgi:hypothetical protein
MNGIDLISQERKQQIEEGRTPDHDRQYKDGELAIAAVLYAINPKHDRISELTKAGALIAAEIDRLVGKGKL